MTHLISNPPKYELEDGSIQVWRGMPKLPDVIDVMLDLREEAVRRAQQVERDARAAELKELEKRRAEHPEEFIGMKELQEIAQKIKGVAKPMPTVRTVWPDIDPDRNAGNFDRLKAEAAKVAEKFTTKQESTSHGTNTAETTGT